MLTISTKLYGFKSFLLVKHVVDKKFSQAADSFGLVVARMANNETVLQFRKLHDEYEQRFQLMDFVKALGQEVKTTDVSGELSVMFLKQLLIKNGLHLLLVSELADPVEKRFTVSEENRDYVAAKLLGESCDNFAEDDLPADPLTIEARTNMMKRANDIAEDHQKKCEDLTDTMISTMKSAKVASLKYEDSDLCTLLESAEQMFHSNLQAEKAKYISALKEVADDYAALEI